MAKLVNLGEDICLKLNLINSDKLDIDLKRDNRENWIPFELDFHSKDERFSYNQDFGATFTLYEIEDLLKNISLIINDKTINKKFTNYEFYCLEGYFGVVIYDSYEANEIYIDFWVNMGTYTQTSSYAYDKGYRFLVNTNALFDFINALKEQLDVLFSCAMAQ
jgi:hypothetical protein